MRNYEIMVITGESYRIISKIRADSWEWRDETVVLLLAGQPVFESNSVMTIYVRDEGVATSA
jgi:hypothetical protein